MTLLQYPTHRPIIVTNVLIFTATVFAFAPLLLTSKAYLLQYLLLTARLLFSFTTPLVSKERLLLRVYLIAHVTIDVSAGVLAVSSGPAGPVSASPSSSLIALTILLSLGSAYTSFYLLLLVNTPAEDSLKLPPPSLWPRLQKPSSHWVTVVSRLSIVLIFLTVPLAFTLSPFFISYQSPTLLDNLCFALRLILLLASPVLHSDTTPERTDCDLAPTMQNAVILQCVLNIFALLIVMIGKDKFINPDSIDLYGGIFFVSLAGTLGELLAIALICYAADEAEKLRRQFQPSPERYLVESP
ncbi:hypothetical protein C8R47DRAFT_1130038 [Mycena vitilis]|nr:hypothetical protein C8R47DRAFT_1130038 [Mycena vitilis]